MSEFYVYGLLDPKTGLCFYVGKGSSNRMYQHERKVKRGQTTQNPHLDRKITKVMEISGYIDYIKFYVDLDEDTAFIKEDEKILEFGIDNICNVWTGGKGGRTLSAAAKQKISESKKGISLTQEHKNQISKAKLGVPQTAAAIQKRSDALKGKPQTLKQKESNEQRSTKLKGRKFSEEHKRKLREAKLKNPVKYWKNKKHTNETKQKISDSVKLYLETKHDK